MAPARSRPSTNVATERPNRGPTPLPAYQPPQHPLNEAAQRALQNLPRNHKLDALKTRQRAANNHLTQAAADVNDRLQEKSAEFERRRRNLEKQGSQQSNEATRPILDEMRQNTDEMTDKLEGSVRKIIDASAEVEGMERALKELQENVSNNRGHLGATQSTIGASQARQNHRRRGAGSDDEGSEFEDEVTQTMGENDSAIAALKQKIAEQRSAYQAMSMSHRYASHNDYVGFKKIVHDAHYPEDKAPPMPHAATWFASESPDSSHPTTRAAAAAAGDAIEDDDDLAVASERVSIKCPLTLQPMKEPVTSQKCPHSFDKAAILEMINYSETTVEGTGRQVVKAMKCPVCEVLLTASDLKEDPVLIRKIKRIQAALDAQNDESSDEDNSDPRRPAGNQPEEISSSPAATTTQRPKNERQSQAPGIQSRQVSMVPSTQVQRLVDEGQDGSSRSPVFDLEDDDDDEDMDD